MSPSGFSAGTAFVQVLPSFRGFATELTSKATEAARKAGNDASRMFSTAFNPHAAVNIEADTTAAKVKIDALDKRLFKLEHTTTTHKVDVNTDSATSGLSALVTAGITVGPALVPVFASVTAAVGVLGSSLLSAAGALGPFGLAVGGQISAMKKAQTQITSTTKALDLLTPGTQAYADKLKMLNQQQGEFNKTFGPAAAGLNNMKTAFAGFLQATQTTTLGVIGDALNGVAGVLPKLAPLANVAGKAVRGLVDDLAAFTRSHTFDHILAFFARTGPAAITSFGHIFGNFALGIFDLFRGFAPFQRSFLTGLESMSKTFLAWASNLHKTDGFKSFMAYVMKVLPDVKALFANLTTFVVNFVAALGPLGAIELKGVVALLGWLNRLPPQVLNAIAVGVTSIVIAVKAWSVVQKILDAELLANPIGLVVVALAALALSLTVAYKKSDTFRNIVDTAWKDVRIAAAAAWKVIKPVLADLATGFGAVVQYVRDHWDTISKVVKAVFDTVKTVLKADFKVISGIFTVALKLLTGDWSGAWKAMKQLLSDVWDGIKTTIKDAWDGIETLVGNALDGVKSLLANAWDDIKTGTGKAWDFVKTKIGDAWDGVKTILGGIRDWIGSHVVGAFHWMVGRVAAIWTRLEDVAKKPIEFVVGTVINDGLIGGFNFLAGKLGADPLPTIPDVAGLNFGGHAGGGVLPSSRNMGIYPGYTPGRDVGYIGISGGEAIMRPEWTKVIGPAAIHSMNRAARDGGEQGVRRYLGGLASGGVVWPVPGAPGNLGATFGQAGPMWSSGYHTGQDFEVGEGTPVVSVNAGKVTSTAWSSWGGNLLEITTPNFWKVLYAHLQRFVVGDGAQVDPGTLVGFSDTTGNVSGSHLHFELHNPYGQAVDPMQLFQGGGIGKILGDVAGGIGGAVSGIASDVVNAVTDPAKWLGDRIAGSMDKLGSSPFAGLVKAVPQKALGDVAGYVKDKLGSLVSAAASSPYATGILPQLLGGGGTSVGVGGGGPNRQIGRGMASSLHNWTGPQWQALNRLWTIESNWNPTAQNPTSTAYGIPQFLDSTWASVGAVKTSDPRLQILDGMKYVAERYGTPAAAMAFHLSHGWYEKGGVVPGGVYDAGGVVPRGVSMVVNNTGGQEHLAVLTRDQRRAFDDAASAMHRVASSVSKGARGGGGGGGNKPPPDISPDHVLAANPIPALLKLLKNHLTPVTAQVRKALHDLRAAYRGEAGDIKTLNALEERRAQLKVKLDKAVSAGAGNVDELRKRYKALSDQVDKSRKAEKASAHDLSAAQIAAAKAVGVYRAAQDKAMAKAKSVKASITGLLDISNVGNVTGLIRSLRNAVGIARRWFGVVKMLISKGLRGPILAQFIAAGPSIEAVRLGSSIAQSGEIDKLIALQQRLDKIAARAGRYVGANTTRGVTPPPAPAPHHRRHNGGQHGGNRPGQIADYGPDRGGRGGGVTVNIKEMHARDEDKAAQALRRRLVRVAAMANA